MGGVGLRGGRQGGSERRIEVFVKISFKFLSLILFEIWHLQNFISIFSKGRNFTRGDNSKKKYMSAIFP